MSWFKNIIAEGFTKPLQNREDLERRGNVVTTSIKNLETNPFSAVFGLLTAYYGDQIKRTYSLLIKKPIVASYNLAKRAVGATHDWAKGLFTPVEPAYAPVLAQNEPRLPNGTPLTSPTPAARL